MVVAPWFAVYISFFTCKVWARLRCQSIGLDFEQYVLSTTGQNAVEFGIEIIWAEWMWLI